MSRRDFAESNTEFVDLAGISVDASASVRREGAAKGLFLDDEQADAGRDVDSGARLHTAYSIGGALRLLTKSALSSQQAWNSTQAPRCMGQRTWGTLMSLQNTTYTGAARHRAEVDLFHYDRSRAPNPNTNAKQGCPTPKIQLGTRLSACVRAGCSTGRSPSSARAPIGSRRVSQRAIAAN
jgi:hypothetical protein